MILLNLDQDGQKKAGRIEKGNFYPLTFPFRQMGGRWIEFQSCPARKQGHFPKKP
jgi:hypothetical protein